MRATNPTLVRQTRTPMNRKQLLQKEKEIRIREDEEFKAMHGPVRILKQGGKPCNIIVTDLVR